MVRAFQSVVVLGLEKTSSRLTGLGDCMRDGWQKRLCDWDLLPK
jgi:hypothetical protein